jgi:hypothetical protein
MGLSLDHKSNGYIDGHWVLLIVVTSFALFAMKLANANASLVDSNNTSCMTLPRQDE